MDVVPTAVVVVGFPIKEFAKEVFTPASVEALRPPCTGALIRVVGGERLAKIAFVVVDVVNVG